MNFAKKIVALGMAAMMMGSLAACSSGEDTKWVAKTGDLTVPAGVYIDQLIGQYTTVSSELDDTTVKDPLKGTVGGAPAADKMTEGAKKALNRYIAVEQKFAEMNLTVPVETKAMIDSDVEQYWGMVEETYLANGVSKDSFKLAYLNDAKRQAIFDGIYGEGGSEAVPETELKEKFTSDYAKILLIPVSINPVSEEAADVESAKKKAKDMVDKYYQRAKAGEDMETLVYEAQKEISGDETLAKPEAGTSFKFVNKESSAYDQAVTDKIFAAAVGEPTLVETEEGVYLFTRYDVNENASDFDARKPSLTAALRSDAFETKVQGWADSLAGVTYNDAALARYTPQKLKVQ